MGSGRAVRRQAAAGEGTNHRVHTRQLDLFDERIESAPDRSGVQRTIDLPGNTPSGGDENNNSENRPEDQEDLRGEPPLIRHPAEAQLHLQIKGITFSRQGRVLVASPVELIDDFDKELIRYYKPEILLTLWCNEVFS